MVEILALATVYFLIVRGANGTTIRCSPAGRAVTYA